MEYKFTNSAENALEIANDLAAKLGHNYIGSEHILYGLVEEGTGVASKVLANQGVTAEAVLKEIEELIGVSENAPIVNADSIGLTPRSKRIIENSFIEARRFNSEYIGTEHILCGIMREGDSVAVRIMMDLNVNPKKLYNELVKMINETRKILGHPYLPITSTCVRVPVSNCHGESINVEFEKSFEISDVITTLKTSPGILVLNDDKNDSYPINSIANGHDDVLVGRIRRDFSKQNSLNLWVVADNLRKGAASNAIQIVEKLLNMEETYEK